jgi:hypothetical protein
VVAAAQEEGDLGLEADPSPWPTWPPTFATGAPPVDSRADAKAPA